MIDVKLVKKKFPIFQNQPNLTYLDSTATSLKPKIVIDKIKEYYEEYSANVFRGIYPMSERATEEFEETREVVSNFINANNSREVVFTRNTTESLNLLAYSCGRKTIESNSEIVTTIMEHHSNFVPWQVLSNETGAILKIIAINEDGRLTVNWDKVITKRTKILTLTYISNVLGTINPIKEIISEVRRINPKTIIIVDAAQAVPHLKIDVQDIDADFIAFSSHKMLGPTGVGVLWGKENLLKNIYPFIYGGDMISEVFIDKTTFKDPPHKFEAGTPAIAEIIAFKEAIRFLTKFKVNEIEEHEKKLADILIMRLKSTFSKSIKIYGPESINDRVGIVSFNIDQLHPHDVAQVLAEEGVCVRAGHQCAMPLHTSLKISASVRASFYIYNDENDVNRLINGLKKVVKILS